MKTFYASIPVNIPVLGRECLLFSELNTDLEDNPGRVIDLSTLFDSTGTVNIPS